MAFINCNQPLGMRLCGLALGHLGAHEPRTLVFRCDAHDLKRVPSFDTPFVEELSVARCGPCVVCGADGWHVRWSNSAEEQLAAKTG